jgi:hypothetical protein
MIYQRRLFVRLLPALGLVSAACAHQRMAVPPHLAAQAEVLPVQDRSSATGDLVDESFHFGPYRVADVDRDWNRRGGFKMRVLIFETEDTVKGGYSYRLQGPTGQLTGECAFEASEQKGDFDPDLTNLACRCEGAGPPAEGVIQYKGRQWLGQVSVQGQRLALTPVSGYESGGNSYQPTGFEVRGPGASLAAVEVLRPGRIWLMPTVERSTRAELACLFAGFMLYQPPQEPH